MVLNTTPIVGSPADAAKTAGSLSFKDTPGGRLNKPGCHHGNRGRFQEHPTPNLDIEGLKAP